MPGLAHPIPSNFGNHRQKLVVFGEPPQLDVLRGVELDVGLVGLVLAVDGQTHDAGHVDTGRGTSRVGIEPDILLKLKQLLLSAGIERTGVANGVMNSRQGLVDASKALKLGLSCCLIETVSKGMVQLIFFLCLEVKVDAKSK